MQVHGHRGARGILPENTLAAFEYAIGLGVDAIEIDVAVTRDDVPVISHDPRLPGGPLIRELTVAELRRRAPIMPTLSETLALARFGRFVFNIELKSYPRRPKCAPPPDALAALVLDALRSARLEDRVLIQSFDFRALRAFEAIAPGIPRSALFDGGLAGFVQVAERARVRMVSPEFHLVTAKRVEAARAAGIGVITWTPNRPSQWRRLVDAGVSAIITDDPSRLIAMLKSLPGRA